MKNDIIKELQMKNREEVVVFLKSLWNENPQECPLCGGTLDYLHKKAKRSNSDWKCLKCSKIYKAVNILKELGD